MRSLLLLLPALSAVCGYKILCVFPVPSHSHNTLGRGVVNALLKAGHQVTWVTPYPFKNEDKNLTLIDSETASYGKLHNMADPKLAKAGLSFVRAFSGNITRATITNKMLRDVLINGHFDAVCTEWFFSPLDAGFAAILKIPWIMLNSVSYNSMLEEMLDEVRSVSTVPMFMNDAPLPMSFKDRIVNTAMHLMLVFGNFMHSFSVEADYNTLYGPLAAARGVTLPPFSEIKNNISILLVNSHPSVAVTPVMPANVIQIAGYHIQEHVPPLPEDLKSIIDSSPCVVYFSMGSVIQSAELPAETQRALAQALGAPRCAVLWKLERALALPLPRNVHVRPWMPQTSILAHPNVKLFITHGGMLSSLEALHYGVPLLAVPVFGDQPGNAARAARAGYARTVPFSHDMGPLLENTLNEMLANDTYYKRAKYLSKLFRNRAVPASKLISHYIEIAIESKGAYHLRSPANLYAWYERWMLDQVAAVLAVLALLVIIVKKLFSFFTSGKKEKRKEKRN
ncbi:UDP-glucosyltransferase 2-like [Plodia interpunctella]|uniref:UDP-glucosyltransferase 2-like n=1 Tax=Plodia interpunctella TaxID=58824 RepID=UPI002367A37B|nr:UDP-glucosyltransferase 2-like [Plodia interpunctella]